MLHVLFLALIGCAGSKDDTGSGGGDATAGAEVYATSCASCHGTNGEGGTGPAMTEEVPEKTDAEIEDIVTNGYEEMAPVSLDSTQMADLIAYLRATFDS